MPVVRRLRAERFDVAVLFPNSIRSAWIAWLAGIPRRVGFVRHGRGLLLTDRLALSSRRSRAAASDADRRIVSEAGASAGLSGRVGPHRACDDRATTRRRPIGAWSELGLEPANGSSASIREAHSVPPRAGPARISPSWRGGLPMRPAWPCWFSAGRMNVPPRGRSCVWLGHPQVVSLADRSLGIGLTKACVRRSALLITTDSGPRHFAAAFNTPVITLFGPTHVGLDAHISSRAPGTVFHPVPCGPCQRPVCPEGHHRCMRELTPESVFRVALRPLVGVTKETLSSRHERGVDAWRFGW